MPRTVFYRVGQAGPELVDLIPCSLGDLRCGLAAISTAMQNFADVCIGGPPGGLVGSGSRVLRCLLLTECGINVGYGRPLSAKFAQRGADAGS